LSDQGEVVAETAAPADADGLRGLVERVARRRQPVRAAIESMNGARFVHDALEELGWDVLVADTLSPPSSQGERALGAANAVTAKWSEGTSSDHYPQTSAANSGHLVWPSGLGQNNVSPANTRKTWCLDRLLHTREVAGSKPAAPIRTGCDPRRNRESTSLWLIESVLHSSA
jgi:hypothetical protein